MANLRIGQPAPNFTLPAHDGSVFTLSTALEAGPVVLVFYTMDGSPTCDRLLCGINAELEDYHARGYQLVGINHSDQATHQELAERKFLQMPLLSDATFNVSRSYDALIEIGPIKVIRYAVVGIDTDGTIKYLQRGRPTNGEIFAGMGSPA